MKKLNMKILMWRNTALLVFFNEKGGIGREETDFYKKIKEELLWVSAEDIIHLQWKGGFISV